MQEKKHSYYKAIRYLIGRYQHNEFKPSQEEMDVLWHKICEEADRKAAIRQKRIRTLTIGVAASLIIALLSTPWMLYYQDRHATLEDIATQLLTTSDTSEATDHPLLIIAPDRVIPLQNHTKVEYSSKGEVSLKSQNQISQIEHKQESTSKYNQIIVPKGQHTRLQLADGSELHINSGSRVIYPSEFSGDRREIFVDGEIYIDVKRNERQPFYVKTTDFEVRVLGTAFNVCAYSQDPSSEVVLLRDRVEIADKKGDSMELLPNQLAQIEDKRLASKRAVDAEAYISWTRGLLQLKGEPLEHLLFRLERYYGVKIKCDDEVKGLDIHGVLDINCTLPEVLERISITASIQIETSNGCYYIHAKPDNLKSNP